MGGVDAQGASTLVGLSRSDVRRRGLWGSGVTDRCKGKVQWFHLAASRGVRWFWGTKALTFTVSWIERPEEKRCLVVGTTMAFQELEC